MPRCHCKDECDCLWIPSCFFHYVAFGFMLLAFFNSGRWLSMMFFKPDDLINGVWHFFGPLTSCQLTKGVWDCKDINHKKFDFQPLWDLGGHYDGNIRDQLKPDILTRIYVALFLLPFMISWGVTTLYSTAACCRLQECAHHRECCGAGLRKTWKAKTYAIVEVIHFLICTFIGTIVIVNFVRRTNIIDTVRRKPTDNSPPLGNYPFTVHLGGSHGFIWACFALQLFNAAVGLYFGWDWCGSVIEAAGKKVADAPWKRTRRW